MEKEKIKIGIISPSNSIIDERSKLLFEKGIRKLEKAGFDVVLGDNIFSNSNDNCGTIEEKLYDI